MYPALFLRWQRSSTPRFWRAASFCPPFGDRRCGPIVAWSRDTLRIFYAHRKRVTVVCTSRGEGSVVNTVKPRYSAPAFNIIPRIEHTIFLSMKHLYSYQYIGNKKNLALEKNFCQILEMRYSGV